MKLNFIKLFLLSILLIVSACDDHAPHRKKPRAVNGVLDLRDWDFKTDGSIDLSGEWDFYWNRLLVTDEQSNINASEKTGLIDVPEIWNGYMVNNEKISSDGYSTYRLKILLNKTKEPLSFMIFDIYSAYDFYVNGKKLTTVGVVGKTIETSTPRYFPHIVDYNLEQKTLDIIFQVSNFHFVKGGINSVIKFGLEKDIRRMRETHLNLDFFLFGCLFIMGFYHRACFYSNRLRDQHSISAFSVLLLLLESSPREIFISPVFIQIWIGTCYSNLTILQCSWLRLFLGFFSIHFFPKILEKKVYSY